jgi:hypothetical protein
VIDAGLATLHLDRREQQHLEELLRDDGYVREEHEVESIWNSPPPSIRRRRRGGSR